MLASDKPRGNYDASPAVESRKRWRFESLAGTMIKDNRSMVVADHEASVKLVSDIRSRLSSFMTLTADEEDYYLRATFSDGTKLNGVQIQIARERCAIYKTIIAMRNLDNRKSCGYESMSAFISDINKLSDMRGLSVPSDYSRLCHKVKSFVKDGLKVCIDDRWKPNFNKSKVKMGLMSDVLLTIANRGASFNGQQVANFYNELSKNLGESEISRYTAIRLINKNRLLVEAGRNGSESFRNRYGRQIRRERPKESLSMWSLDGWTSELYYQKKVRDKIGHVITTYTNRLTVVVVIDVMNDYPVGWAIGENESFVLIKEAFKNAIDNIYSMTGHYYCPWQVQSDHFALHSMSEIYAHVCAYPVPARVKNAKTKPIERYFRHINTYAQLLFGNYNWSGYGIKSKEENQVNTDVLEANKRNFPDYEGVVNQINMLLTIDREKKQQKFIDGWSRVRPDDKIELDRMHYLAYLGWKNDRTIRLEAGCISPTILGTKIPYDCGDFDFRNNALTSWSIYYDEKDNTSALAMDPTGKKWYMLDKMHIQPMALKDRKPGDYEALKADHEFNERLEEYVKNRVCQAENNTIRLINQTRELEGKRAATMITDSRGQHKSLLQHSSLIKSDEDLLPESILRTENTDKTVIKSHQNDDILPKNEEKPMTKAQFDKEREEYLKSKVNMQDYLIPIYK